jgi:hypothetical protein
MSAIIKVTSFVINDAASYLYYRNCTPQIESKTRSKELKFPYVVDIFFSPTTEAFETRVHNVSEEQLANYPLPISAKRQYDLFVSNLYLRPKFNKKEKTPEISNLKNNNQPFSAMNPMKNPCFDHNTQGEHPLGSSGPMLGAWPPVSYHIHSNPPEAAWNGLIHGWATPEDTSTLVQKFGDSSAVEKLTKKKADIFDSEEDETLHSEICIQFTKAGFDHLAKHALQQPGLRGELVNNVIDDIKKDGWYGPCALSVILDLAVAIGLTPNHLHLSFKVSDQE